MKNQSMTNELNIIVMEIGSLRNQLSDLYRELHDLELRRDELINQKICTHIFDDGSSALDDWTGDNICDICGVIVTD